MKNENEKITCQDNECVEFEVVAIRTGLSKQLERRGLLKNKRVFRIYPATAAMIEQMSRHSSTIDINLDGYLNTSIENIEKNSQSVCRFIAIAIVRSERGLIDRLRVEMLSRYFYRQLTGSMMVDLFNVIIKQMELSKFISIIMSIAPSQK